MDSILLPVKHKINFKTCSKKAQKTTVEYQSSDNNLAWAISVKQPLLIDRL